MDSNNLEAIALSKLKSIKENSSGEGPDFVDGVLFKFYADYKGKFTGELVGYRAQMSQELMKAANLYLDSIIKATQIEGEDEVVRMSALPNIAKTIELYVDSAMRLIDAVAEDAKPESYLGNVGVVVGWLLAFSMQTADEGNAMRKINAATQKLASHYGLKSEL